MSEEEIENLNGVELSVIIFKVFFGIDDVVIRDDGRLYTLHENKKKLMGTRTRKRNAYSLIRVFGNYDIRAKLLRLVTPLVPVQIVSYKNKTTVKIGKWEYTHKNFNRAIIIALLKWKILN
jgi:hypothetical protein